MTNQAMTFEEFYTQVYLVRHASPVCRWFHLVGLLAGFAFLGLVVLVQHWWMLLLVPVPAYALAFFGHLLVKNKPTTFEYPVWSVFAFWRMIGAMLVGKL